MSLCGKGSKGVARAKVLALNGKPSVLYADLFKRLKDRDTALDYYGRANNENFDIIAGNMDVERDVNGEYTADFVFKVLSDNYTLKIDKADEVNQQNPDRTDKTTYVKEEDQYDNDIHFAKPEGESKDDLFDNLFEQEVEKQDNVESDEVIETVNVPADPFEEAINKSNDTAKEFAKEVGMDKGSELVITTASIRSNDDIEAERRSKYLSNLNTIVNDLTPQLSSIQGQIKILMKNPTDNREELLGLSEEGIKVQKAINNSIHEINKVDRSFETSDIIESITRRLEGIGNALKSTNLNPYKLNRLGNELRVWTNSFESLVTANDSIEYQEIFKKLNSRAEIYDSIYTKRRGEQVNEFTRDNSLRLTDEGGEIYDAIEELEVSGDKNIGASTTRSIDRFGNTALSVMDKMIRKGAARMMARVNRTNKEIDKVFRGIKDFDVFAEHYRDGKVTGNLLHYVSPEFRETEAIFEQTLKEDKAKPLAAYESRLNFINKNKLVVDPRILFANMTDDSGDKLFKGIRHGSVWKEAGEVTADQIKEHEDRLIKHLGGGEFAKAELEVLKKRLKEQLDIYALGIDSIKSQKPADTDSKATKKYYADLNNFTTYNSPYVVAEAIGNGAAVMAENSSYGINKAIDSIPSIPRRFDNEQGRDLETTTGHYNEKFDSLVGDAKLYEAFRYYTSRVHYLNALLPSYLKINTSDNYVALIDKSMWQLLKDNSTNTIKEIDEIILGVYSTKRKSISSIDPITGKTKLSLNIAIINQNKAEIESGVKKAVLKARTESAEGLTIEDEFAIRRQVIADINIRKSFDVKTALKVYNYQIENYMHKANKEDALRSLRTVVDHARETRTNNRGNSVPVEAANSFPNIKRTLRYYEEVFYGYDRTKEGTGAKVYSKKDKAELVRLNEQAVIIEQNLTNGIVSQAERDNQMEAVEDSRYELGRNISTNQIFRSVLRYTQFKGMSYNYGAAVTNMFQGYISNFIESKDGRIFSTRQLMRAYTVMAGSNVKFLSGGLLNSDAAQKIYNLTTNYDIIGEVSSELEFTKGGDPNNKGKKAKWKDPYILQNSSEYLNQGPIVIATMLNTPVEIMVNGKKEASNLWDILDNEGNVRTDIDVVNREQWEVKDSEKSGDEFIETVVKSSQAINSIHGNYNKLTPTLMNSNVYLASAKQFKTWLFEAVAQRIEDEKYDEHLGMKRKGRWRSHFAGVTFAKAKGVEENNLKHILDNTMYSSGQLMRRLIFLDTNFDKRFEEVDAANLRKNIAETVISLRLMVAGYALMSVLKGVDDDDEMNKNVTRYSINTANRLLDDLQMYYEPTAMKNMLSNLVPAFTLIADIQTLAIGLYQLMTGEITETGIYAGEEAWVRNMAKSLPVFNRVHSTRAMSKQVLNSVR